MIMPFCSFSACLLFYPAFRGKTFVTFLFDSVFTWVVVVPVAYVHALYGAWHRKHLLFRTGDRTDQGHHWLLYGEKQCLAGADGIENSYLRSKARKRILGVKICHETEVLGLGLERKGEDMAERNVIWSDRKRTLFGLPLSFTKYILTEDRLFVQTGFFYDGRG